MSTAILEKPTRTKRAKNIGDLVDELVSLRDDKRALEAQISALKEKSDAVEAQVMEQLAANGIDSARGKTATISISSSTVADVQDWDALYAFIKKGNHFHLLQRRVTDLSYREFLEQGKKVPGVEPFTKQRLNVRSL